MTTNPSFKARNSITLKQKFSRLAECKKPTGSGNIPPVVEEAMLINRMIHESLNAGPLEGDDEGELDDDALAADLGDSTLGDLLQMGPEDDVSAALTQSGTQRVAETPTPTSSSSLMRSDSLTNPPAPRSLFKEINSHGSSDELSWLHRYQLSKCVPSWPWLALPHKVVDARAWQR